MSASNGSNRTDWRPGPAERDSLDRLDGLALGVPPHLIEAIAERTADLLAERLPDAPEPYLDVDGAAEYLACKPSRIYDLRRQGLPHQKDGTRLLFRRADLDAYLTNGPAPVGGKSTL